MQGQYIVGQETRTKEAASHYLLKYGYNFIVGKNVCCRNLMIILDKTKVISADLLDLDFDFEDIIFMFGNISVLVTFQFW